MKSIESEISAAVTRFTTEVSSIARSAAVNTLQRALFVVPTPRSSSTPEAEPAKGARAAGKRRGEKRTPAEIETAMAAFVAAVRAEPGQRIEHYNRKIGISTADLTLPIRKLIASKSVWTEGEKRATRYFAKK